MLGVQAVAGSLLQAILSGSSSLKGEIFFFKAGNHFLGIFGYLDFSVEAVHWKVADKVLLLQNLMYLWPYGCTKVQIFFLRIFVYLLQSANTFCIFVNLIFVAGTALICSSLSYWRRQKGEIRTGCHSTAGYQGQIFAKSNCNEKCNWRKALWKT